jgi:hypothetical protein
MACSRTRSPGSVTRTVAARAVAAARVAVAPVVGTTVRGMVTAVEVMAAGAADTTDTATGAESARIGRVLISQLG